MAFYDYDIAGYAYCADIYCPDCILPTLGEADAEDVEAKLDYVAGMLYIDREREETFDSDDFPKVVLIGQVSDHDSVVYCGECGGALG